VAHVLTFDYLGALGASLLFPLLLVPKLGLVRGSLVFGILNAGVALWSTWLFREQLPRRHALRVTAMIVLGLLGVGLYAGEQAIAAADDNLYSDEIILSRQTSYQRIVLTRWRDDVRLYLSSHLQFSSRDEYRYHEGLVHPLMASLPWARRVLILGGGDGLAAREVLKYPQVEQIVLVDLDPEMTKLFATHEYLKGLNGGSLTDRRMKVVNADAFVWLEENPEMFDAVIIDFPDPTNFSLGKLYTTAFYRLLGHHVAEHGQIVVQSTSPLFARQSFWCIVETLEAAKFVTRPYHVYVPSFGEWGFILAGRKAWEAPEKLPADLKFLTLENLRSLFEFPLDMNRIPAEPNRLNDQVLVRYYEEDWKKLTH
jgi:spermidine synthase